jgi:hypothetical protein
MMSDVVVRRSAPLPIIALGLLGLGCVDLVPESGVDLEPGIDLPGTSDGADGSDPAEYGDDSTGGASSGVDPAACFEGTVMLTVQRPQVVLLLDKSYSMIEQRWDHDGDPLTPLVTRWSSLHTVVDGLVHEVEASVDFGVVLFPAPTVASNDIATACLVDPEPTVPVAPTNAHAIVDTLPGPEATDLYGGTPVGAGMAVALEHLAAVHDERAQAVVLVTDGAANCMAGTAGQAVFTEYDQDLAPMVAAAFAAGVPTYVIGVDIVDAMGSVPVANPYVRLSELAVAGGVPAPGPEPFYNTTDEEQLLAALAGITSALGCTVVLDTPAISAGQVTVALDGVEVPQVAECGPDGIGWRFLQDAPPYESIELCPATCDVAHAYAVLDVTYACPPAG